MLHVPMHDVYMCIHNLDIGRASISVCLSRFWACTIDEDLSACNCGKNAEESHMGVTGRHLSPMTLLQTRNAEEGHMGVTGRQLSLMTLFCRNAEEGYIL